MWILKSDCLSFSFCLCSKVSSFAESCRTQPPLSFVPRWEASLPICSPKAPLRGSGNGNVAAHLGFTTIFSGAKNRRTRPQRGHFLSKRFPRGSTHWILPISHVPSSLFLVERMSTGRQDFTLGTLSLWTESEETGWSTGFVCLSCRQCWFLSGNLYLFLSFGNTPYFLSVKESAPMMEVPGVWPPWNQEGTFRTWNPEQKRQRWKKSCTFILRRHGQNNGLFSAAQNAGTAHFLFFSHWFS